MYRSIPGHQFKRIQEDPGDRFEEGISGWCVLSAENPTDRAFTFDILEGGVDETYIKWNIKSTDSGHGNAKDPIQILVWGH